MVEHNQGHQEPGNSGADDSQRQPVKTRAGLAVVGVEQPNDSQDEPSVRDNGDNLARPPSCRMCQLSDAFLNIPALLLRVAQSHEKHEANWSLQELQQTMDQHPVTQGPVAVPAQGPVREQKQTARDGYQNARNAPKEHDHFYEPSSLIRVLLHDLQQWVRIIHHTVGITEERMRPSTDPFRHH